MNYCDFISGALAVLVLLLIIKYMTKRSCGGHKYDEKHIPATTPVITAPAVVTAPATPAAKPSGSKFTGDMVIQKTVSSTGNFEKDLESQLRSGFDDYDDTETIVGDYAGDDDYTEHILKKNVNKEVTKNHQDYLKGLKTGRQPTLIDNGIETNYIAVHGIALRDFNRIGEGDGARSVSGLNNKDYQNSTWKLKIG